MKSHPLILKLIACFGFVMAVNTGSFAQVKATLNQGDYVSGQDGLWSDPHTWLQYYKGAFRSCQDANVGPPGKLSYVVIKAGTTVTIDDGSSIPQNLANMPYGGEGRDCSFPYEVNRLVIEAGGKLISTADHDLVAGSNVITHPFSGVSRTNSYDNGGYSLRVFGNWIQNDGEIGGDGVDGIIIEMPAPYLNQGISIPAAGFTMAGSGITQISRLRMTGGSFPAASYAVGPDVPVVIDQDMLITGADYAFSNVYKPVATDNYTLRINAGKTVTFTNPLGLIHNQSVTAGVVSAGGKYLYDIKGTLDLSACTGVNTFTSLATSTSVITVDVTLPGLLKVQNPLTTSTAANSLGSVVFLPLAGSGVVVLPLDILSFKARLIAGSKRQVNLDWSTTNELNTKQFSVERSIDGILFSTIGNVRTTNQPGINNYSFVDENPFAGPAYYRLKQADLDGRYKYSPIVFVNNKSEFSLMAYPNPTANTLTLFHDKVSSVAKVSVIGVDGRLISNTLATAGSIKTTLDVTNLKAGNYIVRFENGTEQSILKFIKQ